MSKRKQVEHGELSQKEGSLSYTLMEKRSTFDQMLADRTTVVQMKDAVKTAVIAINDKPIEQKSPATKRFLTALDKQRDKSGITRLIYNTILAGDNMGVI